MRRYIPAAMVETVSACAVFASERPSVVYDTVSYSSMAILARHKMLHFCRVKRVPGSSAMRLVDRPLAPTD